MRYIHLLLFIILSIPIYSQLTGVLINNELNTPIPNIPIIIINENTQKSVFTYSDSLGVFYKKIDKQGIYSVSISTLGYQAKRINNLHIAPHQVKYIEIELIPKQYLIDEVVLTPSEWGVDKLDGISSYQINSHLMNITVGSSYDIMRSATLMPGIGNTSDVSNDLNIRGNSPFGISWYIEDVPVVSPNHFTDNNSTNGVFSIFDSWGVNKSQLFVSAFPVEYGNAISGVLNTELRTGNLHKLQGSINISTVSAGGVIESPIKKGRSSIIAGGRYTFPNVIHKVFPSYSEKLGTTPDVFDSFLKFQSSIGEKLKLSLWGIGGSSRAVFNYEGTQEDEIFLERTGNTISSGLSLNYCSDSLVIKSNVYTSYGYNYEQVRLRVTDSKKGWIGANTKLYFYKPNSKIMLGGNFKRRYYNQYRSIADYNDTIPTTFVNDFSSFASYTHYFKNNFMLKGGIHYLYNGIANQHRIEPRIEIKKQISSLGSVAFAYREQSTNSPIGYIYTYEQEINEDGRIKNITRNKVELPLMKSRHFVLGWDKQYKNNIKVGSEVFYQHLYDFLPRILREGYTYNPNSSSITLGIAKNGPYTFSVGKNYGIELSVDAPIKEKEMYFYFAGTVYNSEFEYDEKCVPSLYNSKFSFTSAFRKDFVINDKSKISTSLNYILQGGRRYTPTDEKLSEEQQKIVKDENRINAKQYPNYARLDAMILFNTSFKRFSHSFNVEVQNVFNRENILERYEIYGQDPLIINQVMRVFVYKYILFF